MIKKAVLMLVCALMVMSALPLIAFTGDMSGSHYGLGHDVQDAQDARGGSAKSVHAPIRINGNGDFNSGHGVNTGSGTAANPYLIKGYQINGTYYGYCIFVGNTTSYFVIEDCILTNASGNGRLYYRNAGITLYNVSNGRVNDCVINTCVYGVNFTSSSYCKLENSTMWGNIQSAYTLDSTFKCSTYNNTINMKLKSVLRNGDFEYGSTIEWNVVSGDMDTQNTLYPVVRTGSYGLNTTTGTRFSQTFVPVLPNTYYMLRFYTKIAAGGFASWMSGSCTFRAYVNGTQVYSTKHGLNTQFWSTDTVYFTTPRTHLITLELEQITPGNVAYDDIQLYAFPTTDVRTVSLNFASFSNIVKTASTKDDKGLALRNYYGFYVYESDNNTLSLCSPIAQFNGIWVFQSHGNVIKNCTLLNLTNGMYMEASNRNLAENNTAQNIVLDGIYVYRGGNNTLLRNKMSGNGNGGIWALQAPFTTVSSNNVSGNQDSGIFINDCAFSRITGNKVSANGDYGIYIKYSHRVLVDKNYVYQNTHTGLYLFDSDVCTVTGNIINGNQNYGAYLYGADWLIFSNNNCSNNDYDGVAFELGTFSLIENNTILGNKGIGIYATTMSGLTSRNNTCEKNLYGIQYQGAGNCKILANRLNMNSLGVFVVSGQWISIENNSISKNTECGIYLNCSRDITVSANNLTKNVKYGSKVDGTTAGTKDVRFTYNNFKENGPGGKAQASENLTKDLYNNSKHGNYWSEWTSPDADRDGIVDNPYNLTGSANVKDLYPLTRPWGSVVILGMDNQTATEDLGYQNQYGALCGFAPASSLTWKVHSNATFLSMDQTGRLSGTPDNSQVGAQWVNVTATSGKLSAHRNFTLTVINVNDPPVITTPDLTTATEEQLYQSDYDATDMDPANDVLTWSLDTAAGWLGIGASDGVLSGTPANKDAGQWVVNISVSDGNGGLDNRSFLLTVLDANDPPSIGPAPIPSMCLEDALYTVDLNATDPDLTNDVLTWGLKGDSDFLTIGASTGTLSGTPDNLDVGLHWYNVTVSDGRGGMDSKNFTLTVINVNDAPVIMKINLINWTEDIESELNVSASDMDVGDALAWSLATNASFLSLASRAGSGCRMTGLPQNRDVGPYWVNLTLDDGQGAKDWTNFTLNVQNVNDAPIWTHTPGDRAIVLGEDYCFDANATDEDAGDAITYSLSSQPKTGIKVDMSTGVIAWAVKGDGTFFINLTATDGGASIYHAFTLTVVAGNLPPHVTLKNPPNLASISVLNPAFEWNGTDDDGDNVTYSIYFGSSLADVSALDPLVRLAQGLDQAYYSSPAPLQAGKEYYWTVIPSDGLLSGRCLSGVWSFSIEEDARLNNDPEFTSTPATKASIGVQWLYEPKATDADPGDIVTITLRSGPDGLVFNSGFLLWTPRPDQAGTHSVKLEATDGYGIVTQAFDLEASQPPPANRPPVISAVLNVEVNSGDKVSVQVVATDKDNDTLFYSVSGAPSDGVISSTGLFIWQTEAGDGGVYTLTVNVTDAHAFATANFTITVAEPGQGSGVFGMWWLWLLLVLLAIIIIIVIVVLVRRGKRTEAKPEEDAPMTLIQPKKKESLIDAEVEEGDIFKKKIEAGAQAQVIRRYGNAPNAGAPASGAARPVTTQATSPAAQDAQGPEDMSQPDLEASPETAHMPDIADLPDDRVGVGVQAAMSLKGWDVGEEAIPERENPPLMLPPATVFELDKTQALNVDEVFIMTNDGILINHYVNTQSTQIDEDILTGMLSAVQSFIRESVRSRTDLKQLKLGDFNIIMEKGHLITAAAFTTEDDPRQIALQLLSMTKEIEDIEGARLRSWNGDIDVVKSVNAYTFKYMKGGYKN